MIRPHYVGVFQSICTSEKMAALASDSARLFFLQLLTQCDSFGRTQASAASLNALVWPLLGKSAAQTEKALLDLDRVRLVRLYFVEGRRLLQVEQWEQFAGKVGRPEKRGKGVWPAPPEQDVPTSPENGGPVAPRAHVGSDRISLGEGVSGETPKPTPASEAFAAHPTLDTPAIREAWARWEAHRRESKHPLTPQTIAATFRTYAQRGPTAFVEAIEHTIAKGWRGLRDPDPGERPKFAPTAPKQAEPDDADDIRNRWERKHRRKVPHPMVDGAMVEVCDAYPGYQTARAELSGAGT